MDRGELFKRSFTVNAQASGFTVTVFGGSKSDSLGGTQYAFTCLGDLFDWLNEQKPAPPKPYVSNEAQAYPTAVLNEPTSHGVAIIGGDPNLYGT